MKRCKDCISEYGFTHCRAKAILNKATGIMVGTRNKDLNDDGKCVDYKRERWKFWRPK